MTELALPYDLFDRVATADRDDLEEVLATLLHAAGVWDSPRTSDGVDRWRVVTREPTRVRLCGRVWTIDQQLHGFWLDVRRDDPAAPATWTLYLDVDDPSRRRARDAIDLIDAPDQVAWRHTVSGKATAPR
ncbi:MAG TPA: hypothetical protein VM734_31615 [Kofleriaceae bacterium]|nr:hypothetical protein [Kofleriaceae bacterium]